MHRLHGGVFMKDDQTAARAFLGALILAGIAFFGGVRYPFGDSVPPPIWVQLIKIFVIDFVCLLHSWGWIMLCPGTMRLCGRFRGP